MGKAVEPELYRFDNSENDILLQRLFVLFTYEKSFEDVQVNCYLIVQMDMMCC